MPDDKRYRRVTPGLREQRPHRLGLVLSGGGARGAFQVGVYERLLKDQRFASGPTVLSGTSAGAINAALIAAGKSPREMMQFWNAIADNPPVVASARFFRTAARTLMRLTWEEGARWLQSTAPLLSFLQRARNHWPPRRGSLLALCVEYLLATRFELVSRFLAGVGEPFLADTAQLRDRLVEVFGGDSIPSNGLRLAINTVDAHSGQVVRYVNAETALTRPPDYHIVDAITVDMVLASASIPLLFPPVQIGTYLLWDGGLLVNTPLAPVVALGAEEIITVLVTEPPDPQRGPLPHLGRAVERTVDSLLENAYNVDRKLLLERNRLARLDGSHYRSVTLYDVLRPARNACFDTGSYLFFERGVMAAMHAAGRRAATAWLAAGPVVDHLEEPATGAAA
ncbi:MAG: patatin-like phospholipase family protein [Deltaproteobacteria bacterium]|nr:patatin-like phospholipase family protein [Deltaproteobacteria bacterium]